MKIDSIDRNLTVNSTSDSNSLKDNTASVSQKVNRQETEIKSVKEAEKVSTLPIGEKVVIKAIEKANKAIEGARREFRFSIHEETHEIMIKVIDKDSGDVIKEIPPEKTLDMVAKMWEMAGIIVDERR